MCPSPLRMDVFFLRWTNNYQLSCFSLSFFLIFIEEKMFSLKADFNAFIKSLTVILDLIEPARFHK